MCSLWCCIWYHSQYLTADMIFSLLSCLAQKIFDEKYTIFFTENCTVLCHAFFFNFFFFTYTWTINVVWPLRSSLALNWQYKNMTQKIQSCFRLKKSNYLWKKIENKYCKTQTPNQGSVNINIGSSQANKYFGMHMQGQLLYRVCLSLL